MLSFTALRVLTVAVTIASIASAVARADALVGATLRVQLEIPPALAVDQMQSGYHRPDMIPFPPDNRYTPEKALLGRTLFYDTRLSGAGALACASCHNAGFGYGDGLAKSIGEGMQPLDRRSPSVINTAWGVFFMWDGRAASLEKQALLPIEAPREMNQPLDRLVHILSAIPGYQSLFQAAFPNDAITPDTIAEALATYERTVVSAAAPFDTWVEGDDAAIPEAAKRGFKLFNTKAQCALCHVGWLFTDDGFHDIGLSDGDEGRGRLLPHVDKMQHAFKTPGLREITQRGPYMHDGSMPTLDAVVTHYNQGGTNRSSQSELIKPLGLSPEEQKDVVAFLQTLTSPVVLLTVPAMPH